jgi:hypothetical protein
MFVFGISCVGTNAYAKIMLPSVEAMVIFGGGIWSWNDNLALETMGDVVSHVSPTTTQELQGSMNILCHLFRREKMTTYTIFSCLTSIGGRLPSTVGHRGTRYLTIQLIRSLSISVKFKSTSFAPMCPHPKQYLSRGSGGGVTESLWIHAPACPSILASRLEIKCRYECRC